MRPSALVGPAATSLLAVAMLASVSTAAAQPATRSLPRAFDAYQQRDISPGLCKVVSPGEAQCTIPEMTAGQYAVEVAGTSTAHGAGARQTLRIFVGTVACATGRNTAPWEKGARTFRLGCATTLLTDAAMTVRVVYEDANATKDPAGPLISIRRLPWEGVLNVSPYVPKQ